MYWCKTLSLVYIPFGVGFMCIVYIAYMDTVVLIVKISFIRFEDKLSTFLHVVFTRIVYISHISKHAQLLSRSGLDNMGPKRAQSFIRKFYIFMSFV